MSLRMYPGPDGPQRPAPDDDPVLGDELSEPQGRLEAAIGRDLARRLLYALAGGYRARPDRRGRSSP